MYEVTVNEDLSIIVYIIVFWRILLKKKRFLGWLDGILWHINR